MFIVHQKIFEQRLKHTTSCSTFRVFAAEFEYLFAGQGILGLEQQ